MPGKLCIIDNIGLHRRTELLLSQVVALLIIRNVWLCRDSNPTGLFVYTTKHDKNDDLDSFRIRPCLCLTTPCEPYWRHFTSIGQLNYLAPPTPFHGSITSLGCIHLSYSLALLLYRRYKNHLPDFMQSSSIFISSGVNPLKRKI